MHYPGSQMCKRLNKKCQRFVIRLKRSCIVHVRYGIVWLYFDIVNCKIVMYTCRKV